MPTTQTILQEEKKVRFKIAVSLSVYNELLKLHARIESHQNRKLSITEVVPLVIKSGIETYHHQLDSFEEKKERRIIEIVFCQSCAIKTDTPNKVRFRGDIYQFCQSCFDSGKAETKMQNLAKQYDKTE